MNIIEKKLKSYYKESFKHENKVERAKALAGIEPQKTPLYKKKAFVFPTMGALLAGATAAIIAGVAISNSKDSTPAYLVADKIVKLDLNPSISISTDEDGNVESVYGNNDEGKLLVLNSSYVGMKFADAFKRIVEEENKTGFLVNGKKALDCNKYSVTVYGEENDPSVNQSIESHLRSLLGQKDVHIEENGIQVQSSIDVASLVDNPYCNVNTSSFKKAKEDVDSYYSSTKNYASTAIEEFYTLCYFYQDKITYFKTVLDQLTESWDGYSFYKGKVDSLESSFKTYASGYESKFLAETSGYMNIYKTITSDRLDTFVYRMEAAQKDNWTSEMEDELSNKENGLNAAIRALDTFRTGVLSAYETYLNTAVADLNSCTEMLSTRPEARVIISSPAFNSSYSSLFASYISSFENHYKAEKESWITFMGDHKDRLKEGIARFVK